MRIQFLKEHDSTKLRDTPQQSEVPCDDTNQRQSDTENRPVNASPHRFLDADFGCVSCSPELVSFRHVWLSTLKHDGLSA